MVRTDTRAAVLGLYAAWRRGDIEATLACCSDDMCYVLHLPEGLSRFAGELEGKDAIRTYLTAVVGAWEFISIEPGPMHIEGGLVREVTTFRARFRATGDILESSKRHVWHVEDGIVTRCEEYQDNPLFQAFFGQLQQYRPRAAALTKA